MHQKKITKAHVKNLLEQEYHLSDYDEQGRTIKQIKQEIEVSRKITLKEKIDRVDSNLPHHILHAVKRSRDKGVGNWLNCIPLEKQGFKMNKQQFRDSLRLRYGLKLDNLPSVCACGDKFSVCHSLSCKKGGFVCRRHDNIRDIFTNLLSKVCKNVASEPNLIPVDNEKFKFKTANIQDDARLDIKANDFWQNGQTAFFDIRVTHVDCPTNQESETNRIFKKHEDEKKREYLERVLEVEHGSFTPLVFGTNGGMGVECSLFVKNLASLLSKKEDEKYATVMEWLRTKLSFEILRSALLCVRGSRTPFSNNIESGFYGDFALNSKEAQIPGS